MRPSVEAPDPLADGLRAARIDPAADDRTTSSLRLLRGALSLFQDADLSLRAHLATSLRTGTLDCDEAIRRSRSFATTLVAVRQAWTRGVRELSETLSSQQIETLEKSVDRQLARDPLSAETTLAAWVRSVPGLSPTSAEKLARTTGPWRADRAPFSLTAESAVPASEIEAAALARGEQLIALVQLALTSLSLEDREALATALVGD